MDIRNCGTPYIHGTCWIGVEKLLFFVDSNWDWLWLGAGVLNTLGQLQNEDNPLQRANES